jgi:hypothetical protein
MNWFSREPEIPEDRVPVQPTKTIFIYGVDGYERELDYTRLDMADGILRIYDTEGEAAVFFIANLVGYELAES